MFHGKPAYDAGQEITVSAAPAFDACLAPARPASPPATARFPVAFSLAALVLLMFTRWLVAPHHLYYFDSANFALSLEEFNPALHQPQPPGYPLFVGLIRIIHLWVNAPEQVMLIAGLIGGAAAVLLVLMLGTAMFDRNAGILAAALLASNPVFWFGGVTNQVRVFLALGTVAVCFCAWRALSVPGRPGRLYATFACLGVAAGFRPVEMWLLLPVLLWSWFRTGRSIRRLAAGLLVLAATTLPWLGVTVWKVGGLNQFAATIKDYAQSQFHGTSAFFGAATPAAWNMFLAALAWTTLGTLTWIWALPFIDWRPLRQEWRTQAIFLAIAFLPAFLFSALVHIGDPDQALASVSILALVGGAVGSRLLGNALTRRVYIAAMLLAGSHVYSFYHPAFHLAEAASYGSVRNVDRMTSEAIGTLQALHADGPVTIIHYGSSVASRQIAYYFPDDYVNVLPGSPGQAASQERPLAFYRHKAIPLSQEGAGVLGAGSRRVLCLPPAGVPPTLFPGWRRYGPVYALDAIPETGVHLGNYQLIWRNP